MALRGLSLFLYGFQVTEYNSSLDFKAVSGEPTRMATLRRGYYSLTSLGLEISRAMNAVDTDHIYTASVDRTVNGGLENRVSIATNGTFLSLLFGTGPRAASSVDSLIGFTSADLTGALTYQGTLSAGIRLIPERVGYSYLSPENMRKVQGSVSVSASGEQETITFQIESFWQVNFKYEPETKVKTAWADLMTWMIQHRLIEYTPDIGSPSTFYEGTIEKTSQDGKGLSYQMAEMLPDFPFFYTTGLLTFRVRARASSFI